MRHKVAVRRLNRTSEHLQALLANLVTALIHHEQIRTTLPKAKEARRVAEHLITMAKEGTLHRRRRAARTIQDKEALQKLFGVLGPRFSTRPGGYTRIVKLGPRLGDNAPMALLELVERTPKAEPEVETADQKAGIEKSAAKTKVAGGAAVAKGKEPKVAKAKAEKAPKAKKEAAEAKPVAKKVHKKKGDE